MNKYILLVDDDQLILYALAKAFENDFCKVKTATTAAAAIEKLTTWPYDLCILSLHLGRLNSQRFMSIITNISPHTKVVIMTTYCLDTPELDKSIKDAGERGVCYFIAKPFNLSDLIDLVSHLLNVEDTLHNSFRIIAGTSGRRARSSQRTPQCKMFHFRLAVISDGEIRRLMVEAKTCDISDTGIGLTTSYPLRPTQVISFDTYMNNRTGVVVWSAMVDEQTCRAGVKFG